MLSTGRNAKARHSHVFARSDCFSGVDLGVDYGAAQAYGWFPLTQEEGLGSVLQEHPAGVAVAPDIEHDLFGTNMNAMTKRVFVLMPFLDEFDDVYLVMKDAIREASDKLGIEIACHRADDISEPGRITEQIIEEITNADVLIADLSGNNANVMYELGYGHALGKIAIIVNQDIHTAPFDVKDFRQIPYDRNRLVKECRPSLFAAICGVFDSESDLIPSRPWKNA